MKSSMNELERLRAQVALDEVELQRAVVALEERTRAVVDPRAWVQRRPAVCIGLAAVMGFWLGARLDR